MNKMDDLKDLVNISKLNELLNKKEAEEEKKASKVVWYSQLSESLPQLQQQFTESIVSLHRTI